MPRFLFAIFLLLAPVRLPAQIARSADAAPATDPRFTRAQQLVSEGKGAAGRALVDSILAAVTPGSPEYAEALFWRASLSASADAAERDYRRLAVEFPLSPRSEDALIRLAQLELARGNRPLAIRYLERLLLEHPRSPTRARASYWLARVHFEEGDLPRACAAVASARLAVAMTDIELRNQLQYHEQRCAVVDTAAIAAARPAARPAPAPPAARANPPAARANPPAARTNPPAARTNPPAAAPAPRQGTPPAGADPTAAPPPAQAQPVPAVPGPRPPASREFTIQVSAFESEEPARALAAQLRSRGYETRVVGTTRPFRVRVGRYATRAEAEAVAGQMKAQGIVTWVTEAEGR